LEKDEKLFNRVHRLLKADRTDKVSDILNQILPGDPGLSDRWLRKVIDLSYRGNYARADEYFMVLYCVREGDPEIMLCKAMNTWLQGDNKEAIWKCQYIIEKDPDYALPYLTMGEAQYEMHLYKEALHSFNAFLEADPDEPLGWCGKGMALRAMRWEEEALACFAQVIKMDPGCARDNLKTAWWKAVYGLNHEAMLFLNRALAIDPVLNEAWIKRGMALSRIGRLKDGIDTLSQYEMNLEGIGMNKVEGMTPWQPLR